MEENVILISALGTPKPKARGRIAGDKSKCCGGLLNPRIVSIIDPLEKRWEAAVRSAASGVVRSLGGAPGVKEILGGKGEPLALVAVFHIPTPKRERWGKLHSQDGRSDTDNLTKLLKDSIWTCGIPNAIAGGDGRVAVEFIVKLWSAPKYAGCVAKMFRPDVRRAMELVHALTVKAAQSEDWRPL
jgi:hypothetical protein